MPGCSSQAKNQSFEHRLEAEGERCFAGQGLQPFELVEVLALRLALDHTLFDDRAQDGLGQAHEVLDGGLVELGLVEADVLADLGELDVGLSSVLAERSHLLQSLSILGHHRVETGACSTRSEQLLDASAVELGLVDGDRQQHIRAFA